MPLHSGTQFRYPAAGVKFRRVHYELTYRVRCGYTSNTTRFPPDNEYDDGKPSCYYRMEVFQTKLWRKMLRN